MQFHRRAFAVAITLASRGLVLRDRVLRRIPRASAQDAAGASVSQQWIRSGDNLLHAAYAVPVASPAKAALLICHGIGEIVEHWLPVQQLLASNGVASLVFDYSGYGRSTGSIDWNQCELDAIAAFEFLRQLAPSTHRSLLG